MKRSSSNSRMNLMTAKQRRSPWESQVHGFSISLSLSLWLVAWVNETCIIVARRVARSDLVASSKIVAPLLVLDHWARSWIFLHRNSLLPFCERFDFHRFIEEGGMISVKSWRGGKQFSNFYSGNWEEMKIELSVFSYRFTRHSQETRFLSDKWSRRKIFYFDKERSFVRLK